MLSDDQTKRFAEILESWRGTRYLDAHAAKGIGVDCVRFVDAVLQEASGRTLEPMPRLPPETSLVHPRGVALMTRAMRDRWHASVYRGDTDARPLDILLGADQDRSWGGHVLIVGPGGRLWHSDYPLGVSTASRGATGMILRTYRPRIDSQWLKPLD